MFYDVSHGQPANYIIEFIGPDFYSDCVDFTVSQQNFPQSLICPVGSSKTALSFAVSNDRKTVAILEMDLICVVDGIRVFLYEFHTINCVKFLEVHRISPA